MKESDVRQQFAKALRERGFYVRCLENAVGPMTLDLHYFGPFAGIAEIKYVPKLPKRATSPVRVPHPDRVLKQAAVMAECRACGGRANLIARIEDSWFVFDTTGAYLWARFPELWPIERLEHLARCVIPPERGDLNPRRKLSPFWEDIIDELRRT